MDLFGNAGNAGGGANLFGATGGNADTGNLFGNPAPAPAAGGK